MSGMKGALTLTVHRATNLKDTATLGKQDPFCKVQIDKTTFKTPVHKDGGRNPLWGQSFIFNLVGTETTLHVFVQEEGAMMDSDIGRADVDLKTLCSHLGKKGYQLVERNNFTKTAGELELSAEFKGTGAPPILSKSAEVFAMEQKMGQQNQMQMNNSQAAEIEKLRLQTEALKLQAQIAQQQNQQKMVQQPMYTQPQFNQPIYSQPQMLQPVIVQQPMNMTPVYTPQVMQQVEVKMTSSSIVNQDRWAFCKKCQCVFYANGGGGKCAAGGPHDNTDSYNYTIPHSGAPSHKAQDNWRWCDKCHIICFGGQGAGNCPAGGGHDFKSSYNYHVGQEAHKGSQEKWNWCCKCQCLFYGPHVSSSRCSATGGQHDGSQSYNYMISHIGEFSKNFNVISQQVQQVQQMTQNTSTCVKQDKWSWCCKCMGVYFSGAGGGRCLVTGGAHDGSQSYNYTVPHSGNPGYKAQDNWRWCDKCHCVCFGGMGAGNCPAGGGHDFKQSYSYHVGQETFAGAQEGWRWCKNCMILFYGQMVTSSKCSSTNGNHDLSQSLQYFLYHP
jgi:hypothetical protein